MFHRTNLGLTDIVAYVGFNNRLDSYINLLFHNSYKICQRPRFHFPGNQSEVVCPVQRR